MPNAADYERIRALHAEMLKMFTSKMGEAMKSFALDPAKMHARDVIAGLRLIGDQLPLLDAGNEPPPEIARAAVDARERQKPFAHLRLRA